MQLAYGLEYSGNAAAAGDLVAARERAGIDVVWVSEAYGFDSPTMMGYLAARTERAKIGSGILNVYSRTPAAIAQTIAGLDAVSGGRALLGLGASGPQVVEGFHGMPYAKPLSRIRDVVDAVRQVLRREGPLVLDGRAVSIPLPAGQGTGLARPLKLMARPVRPAVPIFLASVTDKSVEMTAEIADGWWPAVFLPEWSRQVWGTALDAGLAKRDPALGPLEITAGGLLAIAEGEERERYLEIARAQFALYVGGMGAKGKNFYNDVFSRYGFEGEAEAIQNLYLQGKTDEAAGRVAVRVVDGLLDGRVAECPQHTGGLRGGEGQVETGDRGPDRARSFDTFDLRALGFVLFGKKVRGEVGKRFGNPVIDRPVLGVDRAESGTGDRVVPGAVQGRHCLLGHHGPGGDSAAIVEAG